MAVTVKNDVLRNMTLCGFCKNRCFGSKYGIHHQGYKNRRDRNNVLSGLVSVAGTINVVPSALIFAP
jgi:hypothetical protein